MRMERQVKSGHVFLLIPNGLGSFGVLGARPMAKPTGLWCNQHDCGSTNRKMHVSRVSGGIM